LTRSRRLRWTAGVRSVSRPPPERVGMGRMRQCRPFGDTRETCRVRVAQLSFNLSSAMAYRDPKQTKASRAFTLKNVAILKCSAEGWTDRTAPLWQPPYAEAERVFVGVPWPALGRPSRPIRRARSN